MKYANIILGSYVNGYSIVQELYENGLKDIFVLDIYKDVAAYSNKVKKFIKIKNNIDSIYEVLFEISRKYDSLILYPNQDIYVQHLTKLYSKIENFSLMAFNPDNSIRYQNKMIQYDFCDKLNIPCPNVVLVENKKNIDKIKLLDFPIIIKPTQRDNLSELIFRNLLLWNQDDYEKYIPSFCKLIDKGVKFIASEVIPGEGSNIYAYTGYRSKKGKILGEWAGKKLSQFPNNFGVFSSASNQAPEIVLEQGRKLLHSMNLSGVNQPEFKFDYRDGKYKLMEINLRPMMWHRVGALSGVPLNYIQFLDLTNQDIPKFNQNKKNLIHYVYLNHELINLLYRKRYYPVFKKNLFGKGRTIVALWDFYDLRPFFASFIKILKKYKKFLKRKKYVIN